MRLIKISSIFKKALLFKITDNFYDKYPEQIKDKKWISRDSITIYYYISQKVYGSAKFKRPVRAYTVANNAKYNPKKIKSKFKKITNNFFK